MADEPLSGLELGQYSLDYEDLPLKEKTEEPVDNGIYRSIRNSYVYVYHHPSKWDCFVPK